MRTLLLTLLLLAPAGASAEERTYTVDGVERTALIYPATKPTAGGDPPLVLVFHGHGGTARHAARTMAVHQHWPEAVVAYLQGLLTPGIYDPEGTRPGWQQQPGDQGGRDVAFFDAVLADLLARYEVDPARVYALGHSNGARFVNVLWVERGDQLAALCSSSAQGGLLLRQVEPKSLFAIIGEKDPLVPARGQLRSMDLARKVLQTDASQAHTDGYVTYEPGVGGTELAVYLHPGGHEFTPEALPLVVEFFQRHPAP